MIQNNKIKIPRAEIGVLGGSGFYNLLDPSVGGVKEYEIKTPFGSPSDKIRLSKVENKKVAFIPRHGVGHKLPPHKIPYRANLWAMKKMGVKRIISPMAVGSLNPLIKLGNFIICDSFVNWNCAREDTFYTGQEVEGVKKSERVAHFEMAEPYCPELRKNIIKGAKKLNIPYHTTGTVVVIEGPRFSTRAESKFFTRSGWDIINMTAYPEVALARELGICYANIGLVTDYDAGLVGQKGIKPVNLKEVIKVFNFNNERVKELILEVIKSIPKDRKCKCDRYLDEAVI